MRLGELFKTATFRLAVLFAFAVTISTSLIFLFIYWQVAGADVKRVDIRLADEMARAVTESDDRLRQALDLRLSTDLRRIDYAALFDASGKLLYGNVAAVPATLPVDGLPHPVEAVPVNTSAGGATAEGLFVAGRRPDGKIVALGRGLYEVNALRQLVVQALLLGIVPAIILALITGIIFSLRATRRLSVINQTILRIMHGDLYERLPMHGKMDDIDSVAGAVNLMLDEIVRLLDQIKSVGDNIAHDLRTPLAVARMKLERALDRDDSALRLTAEQTLSDLDRAMMTVTALLRISEIESGRRRSHFRTVDLAEVCANVFDLYEPVAEAKAIAMTLDASPPLLVQGDFDLLVEAIANLVDNAIKFTPRGGAVSVMAQMIEDQPVVRVADSGPGIPPDDCETIFKRFYRSDRDCHLPGNGFGLSMALTIAELHGFSLRAKDNCPGALFEISKNKEIETIPADAARPRRRLAPPAAALIPPLGGSRNNPQGSGV